MNVPIIVIDSLSKFFAESNTLALNRISLQIMKGQMVGIVGPDGAGKTTLIRLLVGLLKPTNGTIKVSSFDTFTEANKIHEISGYMPQKFGLYEDLTVIENLELYASLRSLSLEQKSKKFNQLLEFTNLEPFKKILASKLSGGMKQKLGLACSLLGNPKILFLDEPTVGVDPISRRELWKIVQTLLSEGIAVIWSTSYLGEAADCDTVILLNGGEKLYVGPPQNLLSNVEGRTWYVHGLAHSQKRNTLVSLLKSEEVIDGVIQGANIRILTKDQHHPKTLGVKYARVNPCFEDAFIDLLGGTSCKESALANGISEKPEDNNPIILAQNLTKVFNKFVAVNDVSFEVKRGEIFGLLGPNGAGQTTIFKMLCGLLKPTSGRTLVKRFDLQSAHTETRSRIGYMAQKFSLYGNLNVLQNLRFFSGLYGLYGKNQAHQIDLMIEVFGLKQYLKINTDTLPLGFKQRVSLACAVMHQPDVLFLDEPTSGVDPITRREFWMHINGMVDKGTTIMVTTHFMDEAEYCDRIGLVYKGRNIATGTPDSLKNSVISSSLPEPTLEDAFITLIDESSTISHA